jgi:spore coat protein U-like protein
MRSSRLVLVRLLLCATLASLSTTLLAVDQLTTSLNVSLTVESGCSNVSIAPLTFGTRQVGANTNTPATTTVSATCSSGLAYYLTAGDGNDRTNGFQDWTMRLNGSDPVTVVHYKMFLDAGYTTLWGDPVRPGDNSIAGFGSGAQQDYTIYALAYPNNEPAGSYQDTVTVTLYF